MNVTTDVRSHIGLLGVSTVLMLGACAHPTPGVAVDGPTALLGTWHLVRYVTWDSSGTAQEPYGDTPSGGAMYDAEGDIMVAFMRPIAAPPLPGAAQAAAATYTAFYGTYTADAGRHVLTIQVVGSNSPAFVGSTQVRHYEVRDDTLRVGIPKRYEATLVR